MVNDLSIDYEVLRELLRLELENYLQEYLGSEDSDNLEFKRTLAVEGPLWVLARNREEGWEYVFYLHVMPRVYPSQLPQLVTRLRREAKKENEVHFIAAPKLSSESRRYLKDMEFPFVDLAGGFYLPLELPGNKLVIVVDGEKSYDTERWLRSEPPDLPGVSQGRIAIFRALLTNQDKIWGVRKLSRFTGLDAGTTSRYLRETVNAGWVERKGRSEHVLADPTELLNYWVSISKRMKSGFAFYKLLAKDYSELRNWVADYLKNEKESFHTLWSGAEFYGHFQEQPIVAVYLPEPRKMKEFFEVSSYVAPFRLQGSLLVGPTRNEKISNLWLLRTPDKAIASGAVEKDGERAVCWQQVYVDLMNTPRRGKSIAAMLREQKEKSYAG